MDRSDVELDGKARLGHQDRGLVRLDDVSRRITLPERDAHDGRLHLGEGREVRVGGIGRQGEIVRATRELEMAFVIGDDAVADRGLEQGARGRCRVVVGDERRCFDQDVVAEREASRADEQETAHSLRLGDELRLGNAFDDCVDDPASVRCVPGSDQVLGRL